MNSKFSIQLLLDKNKYPYELLLLADPSIDAINEYISKGECFVACIKRKIVGVIILQKIEEYTFEIMNVSVSPHFQGKGIGKKLILHAILKAKNKNAKYIKIATGNSSIYQLDLYQKIGFKIETTEKNFFLKNYPSPIFENGIQCTDKVILKYNLNHSSN